MSSWHCVQDAYYENQRSSYRSLLFTCFSKMRQSDQIHQLSNISEKAMAPHSSTLAWKIPWMEEPGGLQSMGSLKVRHDWATSLSLFSFMHWRRRWQPTPVFLPGESQGRGGLVGYRLCSHFSRVRLCDCIDGSPPGPPVPGILQARTLEWVAISFSNAWK